MLRMQDGSYGFLEMLGKVWVSLGKEEMIFSRRKNLRERDNSR